MGTAGHCLVDPTTNDIDPTSTDGLADRDYDEQFAPPDRPVVYDGHDRRIGEYVYVVSQNTPPGQPQDPTVAPALDFGLILLDDDVAASPSVCHFGGPTGINTTITDEPVVFHHYGQGVGISAVHDPYTPAGIAARTGIAHQGLPHESYFNALFAPSSGDSGSPAIDANGAALGIVVGAPGPVDGEIDGFWGPTQAVTRLQPVLDLVHDKLGLKLKLQTAPLTVGAADFGPHDPACT